MATAVEARTFWGALLSVLLKCIAALGFATPASRAAAGQVAAGQVAAQTPAQAQAQGGTQAEAPAQAQVAGRTGTARVKEKARRAKKTAVSARPRVPAPRGCEPVRRERGRTLPPTMKQRICAEAHGSSPSARSIRTGDGDLAEEINAGLALAAAAAKPAASPATGTSVTPATGKSVGPAAPAPSPAAASRTPRQSARQGVGAESAIRGTRAPETVAPAAAIHAFPSQEAAGRTPCLVSAGR